MSRPPAYVTNKDLRAEIAASKLTYCSTGTPPHHGIIRNKEEAPALIGKLSAKLGLPEDQIVIRIMTAGHIPAQGEKMAKGGAHVRVIFPPFVHVQGPDLIEVGRSHWRGTIEDGEFCQTHGRTSRELAVMWMKMTERYASKASIRGYSYIDEMQSNALVQLSQVGLQFDESKSTNPFAYYTTCIKNSFGRVLNTEKKARNLRDTLLINAGMKPSHSYQEEKQ